MTMIGSGTQTAPYIVTALVANNATGTGTSTQSAQLFVSPCKVDLDSGPKPSYIEFNLIFADSLSGYSFPAASPYGLVITNPGGQPVPNNMFSISRDSDTRLTLTDNNTGGASYNFTLSVTKGTETLIFDPTIKNRN